MLQNLIDTAGVILPYFLMMSIGYSLRHGLLKNKDVVSAVNRLILRVFLPCKLFYSTITSDLSQTVSVDMYLFAAVELIVVTFLAVLVVNITVKDKAVAGTQVQNAFRCNYTIFGTTIAEAFYGTNGLSVAAGLAVLVIPLLNVLAVLVLTAYGVAGNPKSRLKSIPLKIAKNPLIIGILAGTLINVLQIPFPQVFLQTASKMGGCASPLAFLVLGASFSFEKLRANRLQVFAGTATRLVVVPLMSMAAAAAAGFRNEQLLVLMMLSGTPVATVSAVMATEMGCDGDLAGQLVVSTTALGLLTVFLFMLAFRQLGWMN